MPQLVFSPARALAGALRAALLGAVLAAILAAVLTLPAPAQISAPAAPEATAETPADTPAARAEALVQVLRDDEAREALIAELERLAAGPEAGAAPSAETETEPEREPSISRRLAETTQGAAEAAVNRLQGLWEALARAPRTFSALGQADLGVLAETLRDLALTIVATYAVFLVLRTLARRLWQAMGRAAAVSGLGRTLLLAVGSSLIDVIVVVLAWAAGYAIALTAFGEIGSMALLQTLYLNAFLAVELGKVVLRALLSPSTGELRLLPLTDAAAVYLDRWLKLVIALLGYGQVLVVPTVNQQVSWAAGRALGAALALIAIAVIAGMVASRRRAVALWLTGDDERRTGFLAVLARNWHWPVLAYLAGLALIVISRPGDVLFPVLGASGQILLAALAGFLAATWLKRAIASGVRLPGTVTERLPLLERRLNGFVPRVLLLFRLAVIAAVVVFALHTIGLIDARAWLSSDLGVRLSGTLVGVALIVLLGFLVWLAMGSWVDWRLNPDYGRPPSAREETLLSLLRNAATIAILVITLMFALSEAGLDIAPLLASAGVLGLAIGFGAQKLVQDIITGVFIQFENAINVGDVVTVGGTTGVVERLTIRSVSLRDLQGTFHIIPFSSVDMVSNFMRGFAYWVADMGVAYREDVEEARQAMHDAYEELKADPDHGPSLIGELEWFGVQEFADSAVILRARIKTLPGKQWGVGRAYNAVIKRVFDERGIEIPFPHQTLYFGEDKQGNAPPARVAVQGGAGRPAAGESAPESSPAPAAGTTPEGTTEGSTDDID